MQNVVEVVAKSCYFKSNEKITTRISNGTQHQILNMQKKLSMIFTNATYQNRDEQLMEQLMEQSMKQSMKQSKKSWN